MNKTTQVPTEWLDELISFNETILKQSMPIGNCAYNYDLLRLTSHIKASKYFQQPEPCHSTPFGECLILLKDLADFQNGAPLEQHKLEYEKTMHKVWAFLGDHEKDSSKPEPESLDVDLERFMNFWWKSTEFNRYASQYYKQGNKVPFSEVLEAFKKSKL
jgi:hypothetical protein